MQGFELLVLGFIASSNLLHLGYGLVLLHNVIVFCFQVFLQRVSFGRQAGNRLSEAM